MRDGVRDGVRAGGPGTRAGGPARRVTAVAEEWCDLCDLPRNTCVHGRPPSEPEPPVRAGPPARSKPKSARSAASAKPATSTPRSKPGVTVRNVGQRLTPPTTYQPFIVALLREHGGSCEAELLMAELLEKVAPVLHDDDHAEVRGEARWRLGARRARAALTDEGLMEPARTPGVWELSAEGMR